MDALAPNHPVTHCACSVAARKPARKWAGFVSFVMCEAELLESVHAPKAKGGRRVGSVFLDPHRPQEIDTRPSQ